MGAAECRTTFTLHHGVMNLPNLKRRQLLVQAMFGAASVVAMGDAQAASERLSTSDPLAQSVGYVENAAGVDIRKYPTYVKGQTCANCALALSAYGPVRPCKLFPGKLVTVGGWCNAWVKRAPGT
jgi:High potential iron-sulfur protein